MDIWYGKKFINKGQEIIKIINYNAITNYLFILN